MAIEIVSTGIGLGVGVLATVFVREIAFRKIQNEEHSKLTSHWSIAESGGGPVKLCAEHLGNVEVPPGSKVLVGRGTKSVPAAIAARSEIRVSGSIQSNFALAKDKALVFAGAVKEGTLAVWTYEDQVLQRLAYEWDHAWRDSEPLVGRASVTSLKDHVGQTVEIVGSVSDVAQKNGLHYARVIENGVTATIASATPIAAGKGSVVRAIGVVDHAPAGKEPILRAEKVESLRHATF
jgi:hypothetical protein